MDFILGNELVSSQKTVSASIYAYVTPLYLYVDIYSSNDIHYCKTSMFIIVIENMNRVAGTSLFFRLHDSAANAKRFGKYLTDVGK